MVCLVGDQLGIIINHITTTKQTISKETAILAKEKGFDYPTIYAWCKKGGWNKYTGKREELTYVLRTNGNPFGQYYTGDNWNKEYKTNKNAILCSAPTQSLLAKWLRDVHDIDIEISPRNNQYHVLIFKTKMLEKFIDGFSIYENSFEEGLLEALKLVNNVQV